MTGDVLAQSATLVLEIETSISSTFLSCTGNEMRQQQNIGMLHQTPFPQTRFRGFAPCFTLYRTTFEPARKPREGFHTRNIGPKKGSFKSIKSGWCALTMIIAEDIHFVHRIQHGYAIANSSENGIILVLSCWKCCNPGDGSKETCLRSGGMKRNKHP